MTRTQQTHRKTNTHTHDTLTHTCTRKYIIIFLCMNSHLHKHMYISHKKTKKHRHKLWLSRKQVTKEEWLEILIPKLVSYCPKYNTVLDYGLVQNKITDLHIFRPSLDRIDNTKDEHPENLEIRSYQYNTSRGALSEEVFDELAKRQLKII